MDAFKLKSVNFDPVYDFRRMVISVTVNGPDAVDVAVTEAVLVDL